MLELFEYPPTRSQRVKWALEELELDYASHMVDLMTGQQDLEAYRAIHPLGVVPVLKTEKYTMLESVAIVLQLIDENPNKQLAPAIGSPERARYYQWCIFACAELDPPIMMYFDNTMRPLEHMRPGWARHDDALAARGHEEFATRAEMLSKTLDGCDYMLDAEFSGADILIGHSCFMAAFVGLIKDFPILEAYYERLRQRPAFKRAYPA